MRARFLAIPALALTTLGCDAVTETLAEARETVASSGSTERPAGWESIEDEASAIRLYYQFVDARRRVHFVERLEDVPEALRDSVGFVKMAAPPPLTPGDAARARRDTLAASPGRDTTQLASASSGIVLYSAEWCGACRKAKRHLARRGVAYEERDVDQPAHAEALLEKTGSRAIPVLDVDGRVITGFSARSYDELTEAI
jgi:glutaredoxin